MMGNFDDAVRALHAGRAYGWLVTGVAGECGHGAIRVLHETFDDNGGLITRRPGAIGECSLCKAAVRLEEDRRWRTAR
jgi:hypothetical protein